MPFSLLGHRFWSSYWTVETRGGVVCIYHVDDVGSQLHGTAGSQCTGVPCMMDSCRARALYGTMVGSMVGLGKGFALV
jgi:hypothetical protein